jgi:hypothetical protein
VTNFSPSEEERNDIVNPKEDEGIEPEDVVGKDLITSPFDPTLIRVDPRPFTMDLVLARMREGEINLAPADEATHTITIGRIGDKPSTVTDPT